ncbi:hypothetical protein ACHAXR_001940, partial [Thalassiosira sp. AJA248-18]
EELQQSRRRLASPKPELNATLLQQQMKAYLGGLYPPIDKDMMPLYLRDSFDETEVKVLDMYSTTGQATPKSSDVVFFWHIPKASGSTMKNIMNYCFDLKRAEKVDKVASMDYARNNILNMDTSSPDGLAFSFANQLVNSGKVDVLVSNYFLSASALFTDKHKGKTFTILRHPVDVALSLFHYRRKASWERSFRKDWLKVTFTDYVKNDHYMDNWMVRQLTGTMPWVELDESHLRRAKLIMKNKIFVGIMSQMGETLRQLKAHYSWQDKEPMCTHKYLNTEPTNQNSHPGIPGGRGGKTWNIIAQKEKWDFSLYYYGLELFSEQAKRYPSTKQAIDLGD